MAPPLQFPSPFLCSLFLSSFHTVLRSSSKSEAASHRHHRHRHLNVSTSKAPSSTLSMSLTTRRALLCPALRSRNGQGPVGDSGRGSPYFGDTCIPHSILSRPILLMSCHYGWQPGTKSYRQTISTSTYPLRYAEKHSDPSSNAVHFGNAHELRDHR
ncbi:hypothetical protein F5888DRAFT_699991 [Russula emetica]|nr:hypothetical protein F5888DRAFT_699991 [Russula emetica]